MGFINLDAHPSPESALSQEEIRVVHEALGYYAECSLAQGTGTFCLDGQRFDGKAELITRADFGTGSFRKKIGTVGWMSTADLVADSIDEMLALPMGSRYQKYFQQRGVRTLMDVPSKIYLDDGLQVMVLRAEYGRFLCSLYVRDGKHRPGRDDVVTMATFRLVALTLSKISPKDRELKRSADMILQDFRWGGKPAATRRGDPLGKSYEVHLMNEDVREDAEYLFAEDSPYETVRAWREWRALPENAERRFFG